MENAVAVNEDQIFPPGFQDGLVQDSVFSESPVLLKYMGHVKRDGCFFLIDKLSYIIAVIVFGNDDFKVTVRLAVDGAEHQIQKVDVFIYRYNERNFFFQWRRPQSMILGFGIICVFCMADFHEKASHEKGKKENLSPIREQVRMKKLSC